MTVPIMCTNKDTHASDQCAGARVLGQRGIELFLSFGSDVPTVAIANVGMVPL